jgi:hypothetical protein
MPALAAVLAAAAFSCRDKTGAEAPDIPEARPESRQQAVERPPEPEVRPEEEPLLLLDEPNAESGEYDGPMADNSRCHVCHINYAEEELAVTHAKAFVSCEDCHGASDAHCSDEDNITPPDRMFAAAALNTFCTECHPKAKLDIQPHEVLFTEDKKPHCTSCHGEHALNYRTRRWDKETGELIADDNVRMIEK